MFLARSALIRIGSGLVQHLFQDDDEEYGEDRMEIVEYEVEPGTQTFSFCDGGEDEDIILESEEEQAASPIEMVEARIEEENALMEVDKVATEEESRKRRERRQARAEHEREGTRRKKEGLKRNFLLVDEYTMKPYGMGVGDWRKEVMLLSQNLDPAVGNINQQPEGAVAQIAEWIQQPWEYSSPIKFQYVKEVVARGVCLRRSQLWDMIRKKQPKPSKLQTGHGRPYRNS